MRFSFISNLLMDICIYAFAKVGRCMSYGISSVFSYFLASSLVRPATGMFGTGLRMQ
jgi:hypothetical protein